MGKYRRGIKMFAFVDLGLTLLSGVILVLVFFDAYDTTSILLDPVNANQSNLALLANPSLMKESWKREVNKILLEQERERIRLIKNQTTSPLPVWILIREKELEDLKSSETNEDQAIYWFADLYLMDYIVLWLWVLFLIWTIEEILLLITAIKLILHTKKEGRNAKLWRICAIILILLYTIFLVKLIQKEVSGLSWIWISITIINILLRGAGVVFMSLYINELKGESTTSSLQDDNMLENVASADQENALAFPLT